MVLNAWRGIYDDQIKVFDCRNLHQALLRLRHRYSEMLDLRCLFRALIVPVRQSALFVEINGGNLLASVGCIDGEIPGEGGFTAAALTGRAENPASPSSA
jgi:hypothetical protein